MTKTTEAVLADTLRLDPKSHAELATELLASLDGPGDPDAEAAWAAEIEWRVAAIEAGTARLEPWEHVRQRIERDPAFPILINLSDSLDRNHDRCRRPSQA